MYYIGDKVKIHTVVFLSLSTPWRLNGCWDFTLPNAPLEKEFEGGIIFFKDVKMLVVYLV